MSRSICMVGVSALRRWVVFVLVGSILVTRPLPTLAEGAQDSGILSVNFENDLFYDTDRGYTNGVRIAWLSGLNNTPSWAVNAARLFPLFPEDGRVRAGYAIGQNMYTPEDIAAHDPPRNDRPYAGWLYGSIDVIAETGRRLDQLGLTLGVVGPASQAEATQKFIHRLVGVQQPEGWHTQLKNEPGVMLVYQRSWRRFISKTLFTGVPFDITPDAGGSLGNVFTYVNAGLTVRVGNHLPLDYGPPRIQPSLPGSGFFVPTRGFSWYLFAGVGGRAVARNIFLDGNTFRDSRKVKKNPFVGDLQFGFVLTWKDTRLSYTHVLRTREFKGQNGDYDFGAISCSVRF